MFASVWEALGTFLCCFYQKQWKLLRQWNEHLKLAFLRCQNSWKGKVAPPAVSAKPIRRMSKIPTRPDSF